MSRTPLIEMIVCVSSLGLVLSGCVEIPSEGHTPPDYKAEVRVIYLDPTVAGTTSIVMAPGPDFTAFDSTTFPSGTYGGETAYIVVDAGDKILLLSPVDTATSIITFGVEVRGTMFVLPLPNDDEARFMFSAERYTFATTGIADSTRIRFVNAIHRGSATSDITVDVNVVSGTDTSVAFSDLEFGGVTENITIATGETVSFFLTMADSTLVLSEADTIVATTAADYTVVAHDSIGSGGTVMVTPYQNE